MDSSVNGVEELSKNLTNVMVLVASVNRYLLITFYLQTPGLGAWMREVPGIEEAITISFTFCVSQYPAYFLLHGDAQEILSRVEEAVLDYLLWKINLLPLHQNPETFEDLQD